MADISLNTKQYITLMRAMALAVTLDDHIARIRGDKADAELVELANSLMDKADDFGMSYPEDKPEGEHWTDEMFNDADDGLHALIEDEFWHILAERLAQAEHTKTCTKTEGEHDEACFADVQKLGEGWEKKLGEDASLARFLI